MDYYFVGDEGSLTSYGDAIDFDWNPHTLAEFRVWLKQQYGSLNALNQQWRTSFTAWNSVVPSTTEEARKTRNFAPWADGNENNSGTIPLNLCGCNRERR